MTLPSRRRLQAVALVVTLGIGIVLGVEGARRYPFDSVDRLLGRREPLPPDWHRFPESPGPRYEATVAVVGGALYVFGGFIDASLNAGSDVFRWDQRAKRWTRKTDMPGAVTHRNAAVIGDTVWMAGGFVGRHPGPTTDEVWAYLAASDRWIRGPSLPAPRGGGVLATVGRELFYFGGYGADRNLDSRDHWRIPVDDAVAGRPGWRPAAPLPTSRGHLAGVVLDGSIYAIGGTERHDPAQIDISNVDRYDPVTDRWTPVAALPQPRSHVEPSTFVKDGRIVVIGGRSRPAYRQQMTSMTIYDPASDRWLAGPSIPEPRMAPVAVALGDTLVVGLGSVDYREREPTFWYRVDRPGWWDGAPMPLPLGEVAAGIVGHYLLVVGEGSEHTLGYDLGTGEWAPADRFARRPALGDHHAAEVIDGRLYLFGGFGPAAGITQIFDPASNRWSFGPDIPFKVGGSASAVIGGQVYLAGGIDGDTAIASHARLDPATGRWTPLRPMPHPRHHAAAATDGRRLFVFGGRGPGSGDRKVGATGYDEVQIYDPATDLWATSGGSPDAPRPLPQATAGGGKAAFLNGEFYLVGGEALDGGGASKDRVSDRVDVYDPVQNRWRVGPSMRPGPHGTFPVAFGDRLYLAGGGLSGGRSTTTSLRVLQLGPPGRTP